MEISYEWKIEALEIAPEYEGKKDVVRVVHWRVFARIGDYLETAYGSEQIEYDQYSDFKPLDGLTEEEVMKWAQTAMGKERLERLLDALVVALNDKSSPIITVITPPWQVKPEEQATSPN